MAGFYRGEKKLSTGYDVEKILQFQHQTQFIVMKMRRTH